MTSLSGLPETGVAVEARLLSTEEMKSYEGRSILPPQSPDSDIPMCRGHSNEMGLAIPVEQAVTDDYGQFKLFGLLPGCPYLVITANREKGASRFNAGRRSFPPYFLVKPHHANVHGLHFYLKPRASFGMLSATLDTDPVNLPGLSLAIRSKSQPGVNLILHNYATQSSFFVLLGKDLEAFSE